MTTSTAAGRSASVPTRPRLVTPLFAVVVASALAYFTALGTLIPVLPRYVEDVLDGGGVEVGLAVGAFAVSAALVRPASGRLGDRLGRRKMAVGGSLIAAAATLPLGIVPALWFVVVLRLGAGLGEAGFFIGTATAAQDLAPDDRRGEAASFYSVAIYGGLAVGPFLGETLYRSHGPDWNFVAAGSLMAVAGLLAMRIPLGLGQVDGVPARRSILHPAAVLPGSVLLLGLFGFAGFSAFVPLYVDEVGLDDAGPFFLAYGLIVLAVRVLGARIPDVLGPVRTSTISLAAIGSGVGVAAAVGTVAGLWIGTVLLSIGMSLLFPALFTLAVNGAPPSERSHAVGTFSLFFDLSQGLGAPALGIVVTVVGSERGAFVAATVMAALGLVLANTRLRRMVDEMAAA